MQIDIHEQIYAWREVMDNTGGFAATKKTAMKLAGALLSHPRAYRAAAEADSAAPRVRPRHRPDRRVRPRTSTSTI